MQVSIKSRYSNEVLDRIFRYFMRMILHLQESGIEQLPLENDFEEPLTFYPNLPEEIKEKYQINDLIKYMPKEAFRLDDY